MPTERSPNTRPAIVGSAIGDPYSARTYSGVPFHLFRELENTELLVGRVNGLDVRPSDLATGVLDLRRSLKHFRPKKNALWRYQSGFRALSNRLHSKLSALPEHDTVLQIGVGGIPTVSVRLVAHVEIGVATAISTYPYNQSYGFDSHGRRAVERAIDGERRYLDRCDLVWTNTQWTAETLKDQGVGPDRLFVHPPGPGISDPGAVERDWTTPRMLFVGKDWERKGGPLVVNSFREIRKRFPDASLTVIGCRPDTSGVDGIEALGFLDVSRTADRAVFEDRLRRSTLYCMPSAWESTGIVYMEAGLWGMPSLMLPGQGRKGVFPDDSAVYFTGESPRHLAEQVIDLFLNPDMLRRVGARARTLVKENYMWPTVATRLVERICAGSGS